jgi:hypothetical protein
MWSRLHWYFFAQPFSQQRPNYLILLASWFLSAVTLLFVPPLTLLYFQIAFLPYHAISVTWWHRTCLAIDITLLLFFSKSLWEARKILNAEFFPRAFSPGNVRHALRWMAFRIAANRSLLVLVRPIFAAGRLGALRLTLVAMGLFSILVATIPDEGLDRAGRWMWPVRVPLYEASGDMTGRYRTRTAFYPTALVFERFRDESNVNATGWYRNLLVTKVDLSNRPLANRDLRYAAFIASKLD